MLACFGGGEGGGVRVQFYFEEGGGIGGGCPGGFGFRVLDLGALNPKHYLCSVGLLLSDFRDRGCPTWQCFRLNAFRVACAFTVFGTRA